MWKDSGFTKKTKQLRSFLIIEYKCTNINSLLYSNDTYSNNNNRRKQNVYLLFSTFVSLVITVETLN